jgi:hypothetical protein
MGWGTNKTYIAAVIGDRGCYMIRAAAIALSCNSSDIMKDPRGGRGYLGD